MRLLSCTVYAFRIALSGELGVCPVGNDSHGMKCTSTEVAVSQDAVQKGCNKCRSLRMPPAPKIKGTERSEGSTKAVACGSDGPDLQAADNESQ